MGRNKKSVATVTHIVKNPVSVRPRNSTKRNSMCTEDENLCKLSTVGIAKSGKSSDECQLWKGVHKLRYV